MPLPETLLARIDPASRQIAIAITCKSRRRNRILFFDDARPKARFGHAPRSILH
jgi:hypothetical protein